jgi:hypothetical protein
VKKRSPLLLITLLLLAVTHRISASSFQFQLGRDYPSDRILQWSGHSSPLGQSLLNPREAPEPEIPEQGVPEPEELAEEEMLTPESVNVDSASTVVAHQEPPKPSVPEPQVKKSTGAKSSYVPPGFEDLLEPQQTQVDVYYGNAFVVSLLASYTPTEIEFMQPELIVDRIPDLLSAPAILAALTSALPTNSQLVCLRDNQTGCGSITPEVVEIIFDENHFRVDLFIAPELLAIKTTIDDKFLPASDASASLLQLFSGSANGSEGDISTYNIGSSTSLSMKESRLYMLSNYTDNTHYTVDTLALQREYRGREYQAGVFRSNPGGLHFITQSDFIGARLSSSLDTRNDLDQSYGNELLVFLSSRSRVDILKDDRLISSRIYDTGNQLIDTSELPGGSYEIVLRISGSQGITEETRFYSKTNRLPPKDQPLYFFEVGESALRDPDRTLPQSTGETFVRGGLNRRITDNFGTEIGFAVQDDSSIFEAGLFTLGRNYELVTNIAASDEGNLGISLNGRLRLGGWTLNSNYRRTKVEDPVQDPLMGEQLTQGSFNLSIPTGVGTLTLSSRYNKRANEDKEELFSMRYDFDSYLFRRGNLDSNLQLTRNNDDLSILFSVQYRFSSGKWQTDFRPQYLAERLDGESTTHDTAAALTTSWRDGERYKSDVNVTLSAINDRNNDSLEANIDVASRLGHANIVSTYLSRQNLHAYSANLSTSLLVNNNSFALGGKSPARSAVIVDISGDVRDSFFEVLVNKSSRENASIGTKTIVGLTPYQTYNIALKPRGDSLVNYDEQYKSVTLYPGNVVTLNWKAKQIVVIFGQLKNSDSLPVTNALIKGASGLAMTDEFGMFQAEIDSDTTSLVVQTRNFTCNVNLPGYEIKQGMAFLGELTCD